MKNIKLTIEFDGTNYCGWQKQPNDVSVQEVIEKGLEKITKESCKLNSSGRTDSGVHALNMIANFKTNSNILSEKFSHALNSILPKDIIIKNSIEVNEDFHSRYCSKGKKYRYLIFNSEFPSALYRYRTCHIRFNLDIKKMKEASNFFIGKHNFRAFTSSKADVKSYERIIEEIKISNKEKFISIDIVGNGFLYNMVRIIVGSLVDVGMGKINPIKVKEIIDSRDRNNAGKTMPAQGLYLIEVYY